MILYQFDWPIAKQSWNYGGSPSIKESMERWSALPFGPPIYVRRGGLLAKHMGLKWGAIGNTLGEHIGNLGNILRTWWEPIENLRRGTCWEQRKNEKNPPLPPKTQNLKENKPRHLECMLSLPIGCMKFLFPKLFVTIFGLG